MNDDRADNMELEIERMEQECAILATVRKQYEVNSPEATALRRAAFALVFTLLRHSTEFEDYVTGLHLPLTEAEKERIAALGLDSEG